MGTSRLNTRKILRVSLQLGLLEEEMDDFENQGISDSTSFLLLGRLPVSSSDSSPESNVSRFLLTICFGWLEVDDGF